MAFEFEAPADEARDLVAAGTYCAEIVEWDDDLERRDSIIAKFKILSGTTPGQEGKTYSEWFHTGSTHSDPAVARKKTDSCLKRIKLCAVAAGYEEPAAGERVRVEAEAMVGKRVIITLAEDHYNGVTKGKMTFDGVHRVDAIEFDIPMPEEAEEDSDDAPFDDQITKI